MKAFFCLKLWRKKVFDIDFFNDPVTTDRTLKPSGATFFAPIQLNAIEMIEQCFTLYKVNVPRLKI